MNKLLQDIIRLLSFFSRKVVRGWTQVQGQGMEVEYYGAAADPNNPSGTPSNMKYVYFTTTKDVPLGDPPKRIYRMEFRYNADDCITYSLLTVA